MEALQVQAIPEFRSEDSDELQDYVLSAPGGCCCLPNFPCFGSNNWERISTSEKLGLELQENNIFSSGLDKGANALKKVREWSELAAGPKWKTFIRRFNKTATTTSSRSNSKPAGKFQYDPTSYALNFDDGLGKSSGGDEEGGFRAFSSRYAPSRGGSMDLAG